MLGDVLVRHAPAHVLEVDGHQTALGIALDPIDEATQSDGVDAARRPWHLDLGGHEGLRVDERAIRALVVLQEASQRGPGLAALPCGLPACLEPEFAPDAIHLRVHGREVVGDLLLRDEVGDRMDDAPEAGRRAARRLFKAKLFR